MHACSLCLGGACVATSSPTLFANRFISFAPSQTKWLCKLLLCAKLFFSLMPTRIMRVLIAQSRQTTDPIARILFSPASTIKINGEQMALAVNSIFHSYRPATPYSTCHSARLLNIYVNGCKDVVCLQMSMGWNKKDCGYSAPIYEEYLLGREVDEKNALLENASQPTITFCQQKVGVVLIAHIFIIFRRFDIFDGNVDNDKVAVAFGSMLKMVCDSITTERHRRQFHLSFVCVKTVMNATAYSSFIIDGRSLCLQSKRRTK